MIGIFIYISNRLEDSQNKIFLPLASPLRFNPMAKIEL